MAIDVEEVEITDPPFIPTPEKEPYEEDLSKFSFIKGTLLKYDPNQLRDEQGRWTTSPQSLTGEGEDKVVSKIIDDEGVKIVNEKHGKELLEEHPNVRERAYVIAQTLKSEVAKNIADKMIYKKDITLPEAAAVGQLLQEVQMSVFKGGEILGESKEQLEERLNNWKTSFDEDIKRDPMLIGYDRGGLKGIDSMNEVASSFVHEWAESSNDSNIPSLVMQNVAEKTFDLKNTSDWDTDKFSSFLVKDLAEIPLVSKVLGGFLESQYESTQDFFKEKGIKEVSLYRGLTFPLLPKELQEDSPKEVVQTRPLSSWTYDEKTAQNFAAGMSDAAAAVLGAKVPVEQILSTSLTGFGCFNEKEMVLLGGKLSVSVDSSYT